MSTLPPSLHSPSRSGVAFPRHLVSFLLLAAVFAFGGCGPKIKVTWTGPQPEIDEGTLLRLAGVEVGQVTDIAVENDLVTAEARIYRRAVVHVRSESAFLVKKPAEDGSAYIEVVTLRAESAPIADGAIYQGSSSKLDIAYRTIASDWPRILTIMAVIKGVVLLLMLCFRRLLRAAGVALCVGAGIAGAVFAAPYALPYVERWVPVELRPDLLAYATGFLAAYLAALVVVSLLRAPFAAARH